MKDLVDEIKSMYFQLKGIQPDDPQDSDWQIMTCFVQSCCKLFNKLTEDEKKEFLNFIKFMI